MTKEEIRAELEKIKFNATISVKRVYYPAHANCEDDGEVYYVEKDIEYSLLDFANCVYQYSVNMSIEEVYATILYLHNNYLLCEDNFTDNQDFKDFLEEQYGD